jgi:NADH pyrophosphatase NudC (nudix superfamily)
MKYEKNQYVNSFSVCTFIIAGAFFWWGITSLIPFDKWSWWGFISIGIGAAILSSQIIAINNRSKLRNIVLMEFQTNPDATVQEISTRTGISVKDLHAIILDLKASGKLIAKFSTKTGQVKTVSISQDAVQTEQRPQYCPNCGTPVSKESAQYCAYCGTKF